MEASSTVNGLAASSTVLGLVASSNAYESPTAKAKKNFSLVIAAIIIDIG